MLKVFNSISLLQMSEPREQPTPNYYPHPHYSGQPQPLPQQPSTAYGGQAYHQPQPTQQQMPPPPPPTYQPGWSCTHPHWDSHSSTPQAPPRAVIGEPNPKKRALEPEEGSEDLEVEAAHAGPTFARGRGRGRGGRGGHLWGWLRLGFYKTKPPIPSCFAHKRPECSTCFEWVWN